MFSATVSSVNGIGVASAAVAKPECGGCNKCKFCADKGWNR